MAWDKGRSTFTGLFWPCPLNAARHAEEPLALPIKKGPKAFFLQCGTGTCEMKLFFRSDWEADEGMTLEQVEAAGLRPTGIPKNVRVR